MILLKIGLLLLALYLAIGVVFVVIYYIQYMNGQSQYEPKYYPAVILFAGAAVVVLVMERLKELYWKVKGAVEVRKEKGQK